MKKPLENVLDASTIAHSIHAQSMNHISWNKKKQDYMFCNVTEQDTKVGVAYTNEI